MSSRRPAAPGRGPRTAGRAGSARGAGTRTAGGVRGSRGGRAPSGSDVPRGGPGPDRRSGRALRAGVVAALAVICLLSVLSPLTTYVREQSTTATLNRQVDQATREKANLERAVTRWDDPAYVATQARERLHYVRPGETGYVVLDLPPDPGEAVGTGSGPGDDGAAPAPVGSATDADGSGGPWYDRLWGSVEVAGQR